MAAGAYRGVNNTLVNTGGRSQIVQGIINARVKRSFDSYTTTGTNEDATTTIKVCEPLPKGARIVSVRLAHDGGLTATVTAHVGDSDDPDRYIVSADMAGGAAVVEMLPGVCDYVIGTNDGDDQLLITLNVGNNAVASKVLRVQALYSTD